MQRICCGRYQTAVWLLELLVRLEEAFLSQILRVSAGFLTAGNSNVYFDNLLVNFDRELKQTH